MKQSGSRKTSAGKPSKRPAATLNVEYHDRLRGRHFKLQAMLVGFVLAGGSFYGGYRFLKRTGAAPAHNESVALSGQRSAQPKFQSSRIDEQIRAAVEKACGPSGGIATFRSKNARIRGNVTHDNKGPGICDVEGENSSIRGNHSYRNGVDPSRRD